MNNFDDINSVIILSKIMEYPISDIIKRKNLLNDLKRITDKNMINLNTNKGVN